MSEWTINGQSPSSYGVTIARREVRNLLSDEVILTVSRRRLSLAFAFEEAVSIERDGIVWFRGHVSRLPEGANEVDEGASYTVSGPLWWLGRVMFGREYATFGGRMETSFSVGLFLSRQGRITLAAQVAEIFAWASRHAAGKFHFMPDASTITDLTPPPVMADDAMCDAVLRDALAWMPDAALRVDYAAEPPAMTILPLASCPAHDYSLGSPPLTSATVEPEHEGRVRGVHLRYNSTGDLAFVSPPGLTDVYPAGTEGSAPGVLSLSLSSEDFLPGLPLARSLYDSFSSLGWKGDARFAGREIESLGVGDRLAIDAWPSAAVHVQTISFDVANGITSASCGSKAHLGARDLIALAKPLRNSRRASEESLPGPSHPFAPYLVKRDGRYYLRIAAGVVRDMNGDVTPYWNGVRLNAANPPEVHFTPGFRAELYLRVQFTPDVATFDFSYTDPEGVGVAATAKRFVSTGVINSTVIVNGRGANRLPVLFDTGLVFPGVYYFALCTPTNAERLRLDRAELVANAVTTDSFGVVFHPPKTLMRYS